MPLRADAERNRTRLLDAARTVFAERGLDVTMDEIARCAGVGVGTAYRRFRSRDEIIDALFEERVAQIVAITQQAAAEPDAWRALCSFMEASLELQAGDRGLKDLLLGDAGGRERIAAMRQRLRPVVERLVERARESGHLRPGFEYTDLALVTTMVGGVMDYTGDVDPDAWRRALALALDGLRGDEPLPGHPLTARQVDELRNRRRAR
jgi:AcrR family transcriptional regulator